MTDKPLEALGLATTDTGTDFYAVHNGNSRRTTARQVRNLVLASVFAAPGVTTDNAIARFSGIAGLLQNSGVTLDDLDNIAGVADLAMDGDLTGAAVTRTSSTAARTLEDRFADVVNVKDFGAVGDSNGTTGNGTDDTQAFEAAIAEATAGGFQIFIPRGIYRLTNTLLTTSALGLLGVGAVPYVGSPANSFGRGSWLYFDHTDDGIEINGTSLLSGIWASKIGTIRNQPAPTGGWTPTANEWDFLIDNADVYFDDVMLLNPTKGILVNNGDAGRIEVNRLRGQAFQALIRIDKSQDVCRLNNVHQWPFWQDNTNVHTYTMSNLDAIYMKRSDNPMLSNLFTIFARAGMRFGKSADGKASKVKVVNADFDRGAFGVWVDSTVDNGITGQFVNITHLGETGLAGSKGIFVEGSSCKLEFANFVSDLANQNSVRIDGSGNDVRFSGALRLTNYNQAAASFPAIEPATGNNVRIDGLPDIGSGTKYGGAGNIFVDEWRTYTPTVTAQTGTFTTLGTVTGRFKLVNDWVEYNLSIAITTNGTAAGDVRATVPYAAVTDASIGVGREQNVNGKLLSATLGAATSLVTIATYDNLYPGGNGTLIKANGKYRMA